MKYNDNSKNKLDLAKNNHIFQAPRIWNELIPKIINNYSPNKTGIMEPKNLTFLDINSTGKKKKN